MKKLFIFLLFLPLFLGAEFSVKSYQEFKNEEVIRQNYEESCGVASLATLLNMFSLKRYSEIQLLKMMSLICWVKFTLNFTPFKLF